jgi:LPS-assembly lipoprotein
MKRFLLAGALASLTVALSGCGFTPLYATPGVTPGLAAIETVAPDGRAGFLLREQLDDALARDTGVPAAYKLTLNVREQRYARGVRVDNIANRYELRMQVGWRLADAKSNAEIRKGQVEAVVTYDSADQPYAAIAAQNDGQERAATEAARKIQLDLAAWLAGKAGA